MIGERIPVDAGVYDCMALWEYWHLEAEKPEPWPSKEVAEERSLYWAGIMHQINQKMGGPL